MAVTPPDPLPHLVGLAIDAGEALIAERERFSGWSAKADGTVVTTADVVSEKIILAGLDRLFPGIPIVAEEAYAAGQVPAELGDVFLLVDPLDGTREFIEGHAEFTVNIALIENGEPIVGVVTAPALNEGFAGAVGQAWKFGLSSGPDHYRDHPIRARARPDRLSAVVSRAHATPETLSYLEQFAVAEQLSYGSSLKLCRLAEGRADIYPRLGPTMAWDIAAGHAVLRAAGGHVVTMDGRPLGYAAPGRGFENPHFVAFGAWSADEIAATFARYSTR